jgi:hypothetical protein
VSLFEIRVSGLSGVATSVNKIPPSNDSRGALVWGEGGGAAVDGGGWVAV